jgi:hypothetical protein
MKQHDMVSRNVYFGKSEIDFNEGIETIATTEAPALVVDWEKWQVVREVLPMRFMEAPNNDKVPLLDSHSRVAIEQVKGSARNFRIEGDQLICKTFISESETAVRQKIKEGHIDSVSIGYMTGDSVDVPKGKTEVIEGVGYKNEFDDDYPMVVRKWWKTHELSLVAIGADEAAKFKSVADYGQKKFFEKIANQERAIEEIRAELDAIKNPVESKYGRDLMKRLEMRMSIMKHELKLN